MPYKFESWTVRIPDSIRATHGCLLDLDKAAIREAIRKLALQCKKAAIPQFRARKSRDEATKSDLVEVQMSYNKQTAGWHTGRAVQNAL